jgi:hypothetical protein
MIPVWIKWLYSVFVLILVPSYSLHYGFANFLWFSNVALLSGLVGVWSENPWILSTQAISVGLLESIWAFDFLAGLLFGNSIVGLTDYMFDPINPLFIRGLSLYHLILPILLIWATCRVGYEENAWKAQSIIAWVLLLICYFFTEPADNINWVRGPGGESQDVLPASIYLLLLMVFFPIFVYVPTHWVLRVIYSRWCPTALRR